MYDDILVPTDGSEHARRAGEHARYLAGAFDAAVHGLAVVDLTVVGGPFDAGGLDESVIRSYEEPAEAQLDELATVLDTRGLERAIRHGMPAEEIVEHIEKTGTDLIAMGTHGRTGVQRYVMGSVTERVLRLSPVPVLAVRETDDRGPVAGYGDVLVPTDGSDRAAEAVEHGIAFAKASGGRIHAVSVVDEPADHGSDVPRPASIQADVEADAEAATQEIASAASAAGLSAETAVRHGHPAEELLTYVAERDVDLVAMGTQGRTGLNRYLLGSTTERVVRHSPVPVLAVNAREGV